jgi:hypothetical protein
MKYIEGDLFAGITANYAEVTTVIPHICNNVRAWGAGFVIPLAQHFPEAKMKFYECDNPKLGDVQFAYADNVPVVVCNMFAQDGVGPKADGTPPIQYDALSSCMQKVYEKVSELRKQGKSVKIASPMFGAGLAGGDWTKIESMILENWDEPFMKEGVETDVYFLQAFVPKTHQVVKLAGVIAMVPNKDAMKARIFANLVENNGAGLNKLAARLESLEEPEEWNDV